MDIYKEILTSMLAPQQWNVSDNQPTAEMLEQLGIKVQDYAFKNSLPPIRTIYVHPQQTQPDPQRDYLPKRELESDSSATGSEDEKKKKLRRCSTEPVITPKLEQL
jgi:hypothetical protein